MNYPSEDVDAFEFRMHDPVTGNWFYYTAQSWEELEDTLLSVSRHRGHPMELWAIRREYADYLEPETPWMEGDAFLLPWKRIARVGERQIDWSPVMNGPSMGVARARRVKPTKMKLGPATRLAAKIQKELEPHSEYIQVAGSVRRRMPVVGDIEFVVLPKDLDNLLYILSENDFHGGSRKQTGSIGGIPIEIYIAHKPKELGAMLLTWTGDYLFNIAMRKKAQRRGLRLNEYGIWKGSKPVLQSDDEVDFFNFLDMRYHEPEERSLATRGKVKKKVSRKVRMGDGSEEE